MDDGMKQAMRFNNGLTETQGDEIDEINIVLHVVIGRIEALGRHRSYSSAITKLDEARHWLSDRKHRAP